MYEEVNLLDYSFDECIEAISFSHSVTCFLFTVIGKLPDPALVRNKGKETTT